MFGRRCSSCLFSISMNSLKEQFLWMLHLLDAHSSYSIANITQRIVYMVLYKSLLLMKTQKINKNIIIYPQKSRLTPELA